MKIKSTVLGIMAILTVGAFWANNVNAATWYVRDGGGTPAQCTGTTNAVYSGTGSNQPCAFNHPRYAIGWDQDNPQSGTMSGGDTLYIDGDSDLNPGSQAQYEIGYDDTGKGLTPSCSPSWPYDCTLANLPAGTSTSARTSIIGTGSHKPQLWGTQRVWQVLSADNNHILLQNLEITDHSACAYNDPASGCNYSGPYPYGQWAEDGIYTGGDDVNMTDVYIHGVARYGMYTDNFNNATFTRVYSIGNGYGGVSTGINAVMTGTLTWNQPIIEWNGCVEAYPVVGGMDKPSNYSQCFGQNSGGYGDGLAFGNVGHGSAGNWTITGPGSISFNTQDGLDTLHGNGTGTIQIDKMRFEGNAGNQVKMNAINAYLTNSIVIGDCGWWLGSAQAYSGFTGGDVCRALGDAVLINVTNGSVANVFNNTIVSNGNIALETEDLNGTGCNSSTSINVKNNIVLGGYAWIDDTTFNTSGGNAQTTYTYNDGSDGNGAGTCGSLVWNEDYNIVSGTKNNNQGCSGAHDKCGTAPGFASTIPMGAAGGAESTYYQGNAAETLVSLSSSSAAIAAGVTGLSYWNNGNDYHNVTRTSPPTIGGLEKSSCAANAYGCFYTSDCCTGTCNNFVCGTANAAPTPVVAITTPISGTSLSAGSSVTITATASETNGSIANVSIFNGSVLLGSSSTSPYSYVMSNAVAGTYTLTAQATDANGVVVASNPVTMTITSQSVLPSLPVVSITTPTTGSSVTVGSNITITTTASETNGTISNITLYNGAGVVLGSSSTSPYTFVYTNVLAGVYTFTAQATDANGVSVVSTPVIVTVNPAPSAPVVAITSPVSGSNFTPGSNITLTATASETNGSIAQIAIYYNGLNFLGSGSSSPYSYTADNVGAGTYTVTAVATDANGVSVTSSPITVVVAAAPVVYPPVVTLTSPANGSSMTAGNNITMAASASETNGTITKVTFYNGSTLLGTASSSPYNYTWNNVAAGSYSLMAKATDANNVTVASSAATVTVTTPSVAPSITTQPVSTTVTAPATATFTVVASGTPAPTYQWMQEASGASSFTAISGATSTSYTTAATAASNSGTKYECVVTNAAGSATSNAATLTVRGLPVVSLTSNSTSYTAPASVILTATASETNGSISQVAFYNGSTLLGTATNSPYSYTWSNVAAGSYNLTAVATDATGNSVTSSILGVSVAAAIVAPSTPVVSVSSPNGNNYTPGSNIVLTATASETNGSISQVAIYYNGANLLGSSSSSPYSLTAYDVGAGTYTVTAVATDARGVSVTSSPITITVAAAATVTTYSPVVSITSPANASSLKSGSNLTINATASEKNGTISHVSFYYNGSNLLGTSTSSPYSYTVYDVPAGTYTLTAVATDANGVSVTSSSVKVTFK